ncbi:MAG TPA: MotA/TolQ/ExbB proton channel family protein [Opitutaceae bacterium]|nr:MotA/TolQ/ExbB proton channel family protein [Opitutaceae bacterium]
MKFPNTLLSAGFVVAMATALTTSAQTIEQAVASSKADLEKAQQELAALRNEIKDQRIPLSQEINKLEDEVIGKRREAERILRLKDSRTIDLNSLRTEVRIREDEVAYLGSLLIEYTRAFDSRIHISERQILGDAIREAQLAAEDVNLSRSDKFRQQLGLVNTAIDRIEKLIGGHTFQGKALVGEGVQRDGTFAQVGPVTVFSTADGQYSGLAEMQVNAPEPVVLEIGEELSAAIKGLTSTGKGELPFDPSGGDAIKIEQTRETLYEHILTGGPVMIPILSLAFAALIVALIKFVELSSIRTATNADLATILEGVNSGNTDAAMKHAASIKGPFGDLLTAAVKSSSDSKELIEEVLYERMLNVQPKLERMLPFIALTAGSAPLLGLLGTVTGMINTFKLITVFGTGDARSLSSGISEALVTTEFGLYVAIPALLIHAVLNRKAKGIVGRMEQLSVGFINGLRAKA